MIGWIIVQRSYKDNLIKVTDTIVGLLPDGSRPKCSAAVVALTGQFNAEKVNGKRRVFSVDIEINTTGLPP
jgi:hypothetical protein